MVLTAEESKAKRLAGMKRANQDMTLVERIHRSLINGRPPASELRTPLAAVTAARVLYDDLKKRMDAEELKPEPGDWSVTVAYVTPDLSVLGHTPLFAPGEEASLMRHADGNIMLGLIFGMVDRDPHAKDRIVTGARPFFTTKQTEGLLSELLTAVRITIEDDQLDRRMAKQGKKVRTTLNRQYDKFEQLGQLANADMRDGCKYGGPLKDGGGVVEPRDDKS
jgi:hypothetical protein